MCCFLWEIGPTECCCADRAVCRVAMAGRRVSGSGVSSIVRYGIVWVISLCTRTTQVQRSGWEKKNQTKPRLWNSCNTTGVTSNLLQVAFHTRLGDNQAQVTATGGLFAVGKALTDRQQWREQRSPGNPPLWNLDSEQDTKHCPGNDGQQSYI